MGPAECGVRVNGFLCLLKTSRHKTHTGGCGDQALFWKPSGGSTSSVSTSVDQFMVHSPRIEQQGRKQGEEHSLVTHLKPAVSVFYSGGHICTDPLTVQPCPLSFWLEKCQILWRQCISAEQSASKIKALENHKTHELGGAIDSLL